jgi:hypothetical protein
MGATRWKVVSDSVTGFSHLAEGVGCQDAHAVNTLPSSWLIAAVSDGAGSAPRSGFGAQVVCAEFVACLERHLLELAADENTSPENIDFKTWGEEAVELSRSRLMASVDTGVLSEFHCTLVGVVAGSSGGTFFHIGDVAKTICRPL